MAKKLKRGPLVAQVKDFVAREIINNLIEHAEGMDDSLGQVSVGRLPDGKGTVIIRPVDLEDYVYMPGRHREQIVTIHRDNPGGNTSPFGLIAAEDYTSSDDMFVIRNSNDFQHFAINVLGNIWAYDDSNWVAPGGVPYMINMRIKNRAWATYIAQWATGTEGASSDIRCLNIRVDGIAVGMAQTDNYAPVLTVARQLNSISGAEIDAFVEMAARGDRSTLQLQRWSSSQTKPFVKFCQEGLGSNPPILSQIDRDGAWNGPVIASSISASNGVFYSTPSLPAIALRDQAGASANLLECQSADGTTTYFTINEHAEVFTWRAGITTHAALRVNTTDNVEILDGSLRNMWTLRTTLNNAWEDASSSAIAYLFDVNPNGHRVILQNVAGPFTRFGILADRMVLDNDASSTPFVPLSMFDIKNTQTPGDPLQRWIPHATQTADIWQLRDSGDTDKTSWIDANHVWNYRNYNYSNGTYPNAQFIVDYGTFSVAEAFRILDEATGNHLSVQVVGAIVSDNQLSFPAGGGQVATTTNTMTFSNKTLGTGGNTLRASTISSGVAIVDNTTTTKALRFILSTASANNHAIRVNSTASRTYDLPDASIVIAGSAAALTSGRVPFATTGGILTDVGDFTFATDTLTVTKIAATQLTGDLTFADGINVVLNATTGTKIGTATTQKLGFWNVAPVAQYATTGTVTGHTGGGGTAVTHSDTFTGNTGATAYTIADVVRALKLCGIMAA